MARIRVGVRGWQGASQAYFPEDVEGARNVVWIEIDGQRVEQGVIKVWGNWGDGAHTTKVEFVGVPEFVMLALDEEPMSDPITPERVAKMTVVLDKWESRSLERTDQAIAKVEAKYQSDLTELLQQRKNGLAADQQRREQLARMA